MRKPGFAVLSTLIIAVFLAGAAPVSAVGDGEAHLVKDIFTDMVPDGGGGDGTVPGSSDPDDLTDAAGTLFFTAYGPGGNELYRTDGSEAGTLRLSVMPGSQSANPHDLVAIGSKVYFSANDGAHGRELWVSDGSVLGTQLVKDIRPGPKGSSPLSIVAAGNLVYFSALTALNGRELWVSDGTAIGTHLVRDIRIGSKSSAPQDLVAVGSRVFFRAETSVVALWASDGTVAGTGKIEPAGLPDGWATYEAWQMTQVGNKLFFVTEEGAFFEGRMALRVVSEGAWSSTFLKEMPECNDLLVNCHISCGDTQCRLSNDLTSAGGLLYFVTANDQLWRSNGTVGGTVKLKTLFGCASYICAKSFVNVSGKLFFLAPRLEYSEATQDYELVSTELWRSNGTKAGTHAVQVFEPYHGWYYVADCPNCYVGNYVVGSAAALDGAYYFNGPTSEMWASDGTGAGTTRACSATVPDGDCAYSFPARFVRSGDSIYMTVDDDEHGRELWRYLP